MLATTIKELIEKGLPDATAYVAGEDGRHFTAEVVSQAFAGKNRVQKQQLVYATIEKQIADGTIHAISIKTFTEEEWQEHSKEPSHG